MVEKRNAALAQIRRTGKNHRSVLQEDRFMRDRRYHGRLKTDIRALIFIGDEHREAGCTVKDISETGICFEVLGKDVPLDHIHIGDKVDFQFVDIYMCMQGRRTSVVSGSCFIKHADVVRSKILIGCILNNARFEKYVMDKKLAVTAMRYDGYRAWEKP